MAAQGFTNFTGVAVDGTKTAGTDLGGATASTSNSGAASASNSTADAVSSAPASVSSAAPVGCGVTTMVTVTRAVSFITSKSKNLKLTKSGCLFRRDFSGFFCLCCYLRRRFIF
jgi:hypothetical protein